MEDGGLAKLSMRKLAEKLGLSPMAPYYYIGNKDALLDRMVDTVIEPVRVPGEGPWDERVRSTVQQTRRAIARYPELARVMQQRAPSAEQKRLAMETMAVFRESGLPQPMATSVSHVLLDYIFGSLSRQALALAGGTTTEDLLEAEFAFGVDLILAGVTSSVMPAETRRTRTTPPRQKR
jgi:AcrR family transcriptional regulator